MNLICFLQKSWIIKIIFLSLHQEIKINLVMEKIKYICMVLGCIFAFTFYISSLIGFLSNTIPFEHSMLNFIAALLLTIIIKMDLKENEYDE